VQAFACAKQPRGMHPMTRRDVFQAIADPTRREIITLISRQPLNLNAVAGNFDMSRQAISLHIKILRECGLILIQQEGRDRYCSIQPKKLAEVADWVEPFRNMWEERFDRVDLILKNLKTKKMVGKNKQNKLNKPKK
jgi:DNA-binding transcriptional ArsR family regulator